MKGLTDFDYYGFFPLIMFSSILGLNYLMNYGVFRLTESFVEKAQYNAVEDLLFVTTNDVWGNSREKVYEMAHLEFLTPYQKADTDKIDMSEDGLTKITCLNTGDTLLMFNAPKYWTDDSRSEFMGRVMNLWDEDVINSGILRDC